MRWILTRGLFFGGIVLIGIIYTACTEAQRNDEGVITDSGKVEATKFQVGDCFLEIATEEFADAEGVPCSAPHAFEVFAEAKIPLEMTPESSQFATFAEDFCTENAYTYVDPSFDFMNITYDIIVPTDESFLKGDRTFQCIFLSTDGSNLVETFKDSSR